MGIHYVVGLVCLVVVACNVVAEEQAQLKYASKEHLQKQKDIYRLFKHIPQKSYYPDHMDIGTNYDIEQHVNDYDHPENVREFLRLYRTAFLKKGEIFSVFNDVHLRQAIALYKILYYAKTYEAFYKTAVWARENVNEGIFLYATSVAIYHRADTRHIAIPPIYEIYPFYFFDGEQIHQFQKMKQKNPEIFEQKHYHNHTSLQLVGMGEHDMSYFTEDVGLNAFYYNYNIRHPFWLQSREYNLENDKRGERHYYMTQQLLARIYLERLSNGHSEHPLFNWEAPYKVGYRTNLLYENGKAFPVRPHHANLHESSYSQLQSGSLRNKYTFSYSLVQTFERRIADAIDTGIIYDREGHPINLYSTRGLNLLGNLIQCNADSPNRRLFGNYEGFARHLLGYSIQPINKDKSTPSVLEHYETSLRDPAFYQFYKRIIYLIQKYKSNISPYTKDDLHYPNYQIQKAEFVADLITYMDYFYIDASNGVYVTPDEYVNDKYHVGTWTTRLDHLPIIYKLRIKSKEDAKVAIRIFIGPTKDEHGHKLSVAEQRLNFVKFDHIITDLVVGDNDIVKLRSQQYDGYQNERTSYRKLYEQVLVGLEKDEKVPLDGSEVYYGFPSRLLLPKGTKRGYEYAFFFVVTPYSPVAQPEDNIEYYYPKSIEYTLPDGRALGFPFDRPIEDEDLFQADNMHVIDAPIYHYDFTELNKVPTGNI